MKPSIEFEREMKRLSTAEAAITMLQITFVVLVVAFVVITNWP